MFLVYILKLSYNNLYIFRSLTLVPTHACIIKVFFLALTRCPLGARLNNFFYLALKSAEIINDGEIVNLDQFIRNMWREQVPSNVHQVKKILIKRGEKLRQE